MSAYVSLHRSLSQELDPLSDWNMLLNAYSAAKQQAEIERAWEDLLSFTQTNPRYAVLLPDQPAHCDLLSEQEVLQEVHTDKLVPESNDPCCTIV